MEDQKPVQQFRCTHTEVAIWAKKPCLTAAGQEHDPLGKLTVTFSPASFWHAGARHINAFKACQLPAVSKLTHMAYAWLLDQYDWIPPDLTTIDKEKPLHGIHFQGSGSTEVAIWANEPDQPELNAGSHPLYSVTFHPGCRPNEKPKKARHFHVDELLTVAFLATEALDWIMTEFSWDRTDCSIGA